MPEEPLNPVVSPLYQQRFAENTAGIVAAITACIVAAGGPVTTYPSNTAGIIRALMDLELAISGGGGGTPGVAVKLPMIAGEGLTKGDAVYVSSIDGRIYKATNTASLERATVLGLVEANVASGASVNVIARGPLSGFAGLTTASEYFLGLSGAITTTPPGGGGTYLVRIGQAVSATAMDLQPQSPIALT